MGGCPRFPKSSGINKIGIGGGMLCASRRTSPDKPRQVRTSRMHSTEMPITGTLQRLPRRAQGMQRLRLAVALILGLKMGGLGWWWWGVNPIGDLPAR